MKIAIIGAGLMGRLLALSLLKKNSQAAEQYAITLFDKDDKLAHNSAAYAAAGLLTPLGESLHCEPNIVEMGFASLSLWPKLLKLLNAPDLLQQTGAVMVSHEQDKGDYQRFVRHLHNNYSAHQIEKLDRAGLLEIEPEIGRSFNQGLYLPQEGQLENRGLLTALTKQLVQLTEQGENRLAWLSQCNVVSIETNVSQSTVSFIDEKNQQPKTEYFDLVIDCRGTGASSKLSVADCKPLTDLRSVRGEVFRLFAPQVNISRPIRLMHPRYQLYIAPKPDNIYTVGATEIESDDSSNMTVRSAMELLSAAYSVHPGFAEANIVQHISQCRPAFSDNQPKIIKQDTLIQVNGLYRHGYLISPVVLEQTLAVIDNVLNNTTHKLPFNELLPVTYADSGTLNENCQEVNYEHSY